MGGKLRLLEPPGRWFLGMAERYDLREVPLDAAIACAAAALPLLHRDPFDRVIVALAQARGLTVLTSDENIRQYAGVKTLWRSGGPTPATPLGGRGNATPWRGDAHEAASSSDQCPRSR